MRLHFTFAYSIGYHLVAVTSIHGCFILVRDPTISAFASASAHVSLAHTEFLNNWQNEFDISSKEIPHPNLG